MRLNIIAITTSIIIVIIPFTIINCLGVSWKFLRVYVLAIYSVVRRTPHTINPALYNEKQSKWGLNQHQTIQKPRERAFY